MAVRTLAAVTLLLLAAGCSSINGAYPRTTPILPAASVRLTETLTLTLEKLATYASVAAVAYVVLDPMAPNWQIAEAPLPDGTWALQMRMKRFHTGGDGEARLVFHRRAGQLAREGGHAGYEILAYSEGLDSTLPAAQRYGEGVVRMVGRGK